MAVHLLQLAYYLGGTVWALYMDFGEGAEFPWPKVPSKGLESSFGSLALDDDVDGFFNRDVLGQGCGSRTFLREDLTLCFCIGSNGS
jgi:hypothetical protein